MRKLLTKTFFQFFLVVTVFQGILANSAINRKDWGSLVLIVQSWAFAGLTYYYMDRYCCYMDKYNKSLDDRLDFNNYIKLVFKQHIAYEEVLRDTILKQGSYLTKEQNQESIDYLLSRTEQALAELERHEPERS